MSSELRAFLIRRTHRVHRWAGSAACLLLLVWFASGIAMVFARFPRHDLHERLASAIPLRWPSDFVPARVERHLASDGMADGSALRLAMVEGEPRYLLREASGRVALTSDGSAVRPLDGRRALEAASAPRGHVIDVLSREPDQWTVSGLARGGFPLFRVALHDGAGTERYVSGRTGEVLQESTQRERVLAWLGPIPHWIYPTLLRSDRALWRSTVLWLSALGLLVTTSGLVAGTHVYLTLRRRGRTMARGIKDRTLRWHQTLGLCFGLLASTWLFSGALSLTPFHWTGDGTHEDALARRLHGSAKATALRPLATLEACRAHMHVREIHVKWFAGALYAVCFDEAERSRLVRQHPGLLHAQSELSASELERRVRVLSSSVRLDEAHKADDYYYPSHDHERIVLPYYRAALDDRERTVIYLDPRRLDILSVQTTRTRVERWLYHGLHSLDFPALTAHPVLWRSVLVVAMLLGCALSGLGSWMFVRRLQRRQRTRAAVLDEPRVLRIDEA